MTGNVATRSPRALWAEVLGLYFVTLLLIRGVVSLQKGLGLPPDVLVVVPLLFMALPTLWLERRGEHPADFALTLELGQLWPALKLNLLVFGVILPPFLVGNHFYQGWLGYEPVGRLPQNYLIDVVAYHAFFVALPEELFYRGYMQSRLNQLYPKRWKLLGVWVGPAMLWTTVLFTVGHSLVTLRWWHFAILFPSLLFGWLREKTGNVMAGALCHACCNILMVTLETWYGVIPR